MLHPINDYKERIRERASNLNVDHLRGDDARKTLLKMLDSSFGFLLFNQPRIIVNGIEYKCRKQVTVRKFFYVDEYGPNIKKDESWSDNYKGEREELMTNLKQKAVKWPKKADSEDDILLLFSKPFTSIERGVCETPGIKLEGLVCRRC